MTAVTAGGFIYVSGTRAPQRSGAMAGDVGTQTRRVLERIREILAGAGASLDGVVAVTVYLKSASDFQAMNEAYRTFWSGAPPTRTTVGAGLVDPEALVEISAVAVPSGGERAVVHPGDWISSPNPYSYAIRSGDTVFLSGLVSRKGRDNSVVSGDITTQTRVVLDNAGELLRAAGLGFEHVVSTRVFLPDTSMFDRMNAAYAPYFRSSPPARATVGARLAGTEYIVEMTMIATSSPRSQIDVPGAPFPNLPLSTAIRAGTRLYVSGALGYNEANRDDAAGQTRETLARTRRTLDAAGYSPSDVVDVTVFVTDMGVYPSVDEAYRAFFEGSLPARTVVQTALVPRDGLVEIMMTAAAR